MYTARTEGTYIGHKERLLARKNGYAEDRGGPEETPCTLQLQQRIYHKSCRPRRKQENIYNACPTDTQARNVKV